MDAIDTNKLQTLLAMLTAAGATKFRCGGVELEFPAPAPAPAAVPTGFVRAADRLLQGAPDAPKIREGYHELFGGNVPKLSQTAG